MDFSLVQDHSGEDVMWEELHDLLQSSGDYDIGESQDACTVRGIQFLKWLMQRCAHLPAFPIYTNIFMAVVSIASKIGGYRPLC